MDATRTTQLHVTTTDDPGQLARVLSVAADAGINILAYVGYRLEPGVGRILLVTEDNGALATKLRDAGFELSTRAVVLVRHDDQVGISTAMAEKITNAGVNLTRAYATAAGDEYITIYQAEETDSLMAALLK